jgi:predicted DNA-binding WGR domain protein
MNRSHPNDSKLSLDDTLQKHDHVSMITQPYHLYVERTDLTQNMARFYAISIEPNLFGEACLMRCWGRIGTSGQTMSHSFETEKEAIVLFLELLRQKKRRGYSGVARKTGASN